MPFGIRIIFYLVEQGPSGGIQVLEPVSVLLHKKYIPGNASVSEFANFF